MKNCKKNLASAGFSGKYLAIRHTREQYERRHGKSGIKLARGKNV